MKAVTWHGRRDVRVDTVAEVGREVSELKEGDRVVVPFTISCGTCFMCGQGPHSQ